MTRFAAPRLDQSLLDTIIAKHLVPKCAMQVKRSSELGPYERRLKNDYRCDCYFETATTGSAAAECKPCRGSSDCAGDRPFCNDGFCEVH